jgi:hypothetical protein
MDLARLVFILVVVGGYLVHLKVDPQLGRLIMLGGAAGLLGVFGLRSFRGLKARHTIRTEDSTAAAAANSTGEAPEAAEPPRG